MPNSGVRFNMPNRRFSPRFLVMCGVVALAGCSGTVDQRGNLPDPVKLAEIQPGVTTKDGIAQLLGTPSSVSTFNDKTWYYISRRTEQVAFFDPKVLDQEVVVVAFDDSGIVRDVGRRTLADGQAIEPVARETPAPGHELTFIEQLIGNVGRFSAPTGNSKTPGR
jgi:outer membrane protein assembly factor BamE (lipoprotein component of BamABCDE complex)